MPTVLEPFRWSCNHVPEGLAGQISDCFHLVDLAVLALWLDLILKVFSNLDISVISNV